MNRRTVLIVSVWSLLSAIALAQQPATRAKPTDKPNAIEPQAMAALNRMRDYLKTLKTFRIKSEVSKDEIVDTTMKVQKRSLNEVTVQLPNRMFADVQGDDHSFKFIYDGQTLTLYETKGKHYATAPAPPTVTRTLDAIRARYGIVFPMADFIYMAAAENLLQNTTGAGHLGISRIGGVETDHIAVRQADVDWQVWIERTKTPLPRRIVITNKEVASQPQYVADLEWDLSPDFNESLFTFNPPSDAVRIKFARAPQK